MSDSSRAHELEQSRQEITDRIYQHVARSGLRLNPDSRLVAALVEGLVRRKFKFGDYYCPCRIVTGNDVVDRANICPCETHAVEIAENGRCHCALFMGGNP